MESLIHKYLTREFEILNYGETSLSMATYNNYGVYRRNEISRFKREINASCLIKELNTVFGINNDDCKHVVNRWCYINNYLDLEHYWDRFHVPLPKISDMIVSPVWSLADRYPYVNFMYHDSSPVIGVNATLLLK